MDKTLKRKFVLVATLSVAFMLLCMVGTINAINYFDLRKQTDLQFSWIITRQKESLDVLDSTIDREARETVRPELPPYEGGATGVGGSGGSMSAPGGGPDFGSMGGAGLLPFFTVTLDQDGGVLGVDVHETRFITEEEATQYGLEAWEQQATVGQLGDYEYRTMELDSSTLLIFLDVSRDAATFTSFLHTSLWVAALALLLTLVISYLLASVAVRPILASHEKQKRFITDASHEMKTPLTVISANIDVLEMTTGENKWLTRSKEQVSRLADLVSHLVSLSRMDEGQGLEKQEISLSQMAEMAAESFHAIALTQGKTFSVAIAPDLRYRGDQKLLSQVLYILLDNGFKYASEGGNVSLTLEKQNGKVHLTVTNDVTSIAKGAHDEFFDRFYRADKSRNSQTGGFGIGLSLAKSIVELHRGKITAKSVDGASVTMDVVLS